MTLESSGFELRKFIPGLFRQLLIWVPVMIGVVHQLLMFFLNTPDNPTQGDGIYVYVTPPEYVYPFVTLAYSWWFVLLFGASLTCILIYSNRIGNIPQRFVFPFYAYILFLLILVKPI